MADAPKTSIQRSWKSTIGWLVAAVISLLLSVALFMTIVSGPVTVGIALIPAILALIFLFSAAGSGVAACPSCGHALTGLGTSTNDGVLCPHCHGYFEGKNAQLWATDPERIADSPTFTSPLPEKFTFPEGCCVCGKPVTQRIAIKYTTMNASSAVTNPVAGVTSNTTTTVEVPHCAEHKDGASLTGNPSKMHIRFRSYPYLRAFCAANDTTPG
jgi:hypothetical protein